MKATKKSKAISVCATVVGMCVIGGTLTGFVPADADTVNATDAVAAVQRVAPEAVSNVATTTSDTDTAVQASVSGVEMSVPEDASDGVRVSGGTELAIGLPFADQADNAANSQEPGVVVYDNNNGSSTVPVTHADGTLQISTVITNSSAPTRYDYPITFPGDQPLHLNADGSASVVTADGTPSVVFAVPWAKDTNGDPVPTHFEVTGNTLTQVIDFTSETAFPVVADPTASYYSYNCVNPNGSSYFMKPGENLVNCKGSYLQKYINGKMVKSVALKYNGGGTTVKVTGAGWCVASLAGTAALAWNPLTATGAWLIGTASTLLGVYGSCKDL